MHSMSQTSTSCMPQVPCLPNTSAREQVAAHPIAPQTREADSVLSSPQQREGEGKGGPLAYHTLHAHLPPMSADDRLTDVEAQP